LLDWPIFIDKTLDEKVNKTDEYNYLDVINDVLLNGEIRETRNSITRSKFGLKIEFDNINEVVKFINKNEKPLALYIFSKNKKNINTVLNNTSSGGVCINHSTLHYSNNNLPFCGINNSGTGRCHGVHGFNELSNKKSVFKQNLSLSPTDFLFPPYTNFKKKLLISSRTSGLAFSIIVSDAEV
jgi:hypothetical protein